MEQLLEVLLEEFESLEAEYPSAEQSEFCLRDCLGMMLSVFVFKYPSLLHFTEELKGLVRSPDARLDRVFKARTLENVQRLFQLSGVPSDTTLRRRIDVIPTAVLDRLFVALMKVLQQWEWWSEFTTERGEYLLVVDGSQLYSSKKVHCDGCRETHHRDGSVTHSHQLVTAAIVNPEGTVTIPIGVEPIGRDTGTSKNECEQVAAKKLLRKLRQQFPDIRFCVVADALYSTAPMIDLLGKLNMSYLLAVKPGQRQRQGVYTYEARSGLSEARWQRASRADAQQERYAKDRGRLSYRVLSGRALHDRAPQTEVTVLQCERQLPNKGTQVVGEWVTNHEIIPTTAAVWVRYARRRWNIENCLFKTMKAVQGMNFEHNFGHGKQHLCNNIGLLMMVAACLDQLCQLSCQMFRMMRGGTSSWRGVWERQRALLNMVTLTDWPGFYEKLLWGLDPPEPS